MTDKKVEYVVLHDFTDLEDKNKVYEQGKPYPRPANKKVDAERLKALLGSKNKQGRPVIKEVEVTEEAE